MQKSLGALALMELVGRDFWTRRRPPPLGRPAFSQSDLASKPNQSRGQPDDRRLGGDRRVQKAPPTNCMRAWTSNAFCMS